jgi:hypothetical protein
MKQLAAAILVAACGGGGNHQADVDAAPDSPPDAPAFVEAPHGNVPQVVSIGGPVLTHPKIVPIFFASDSTPVTTDIEAFVLALKGSDYWRQTTSEYGVGDITIGTSIVLTAPVPTTDTALESFLAQQLDGTHAEFGNVDPNTIYSVFLPAGAVLQTQFGQSCKAFGAYHSETSNAQGAITYALMPRCQGGLESLTVATSHEWIEAATDPLPFTNGAFQNMDPEHAVWGLAPGAELGDMCEFLSNAADFQVGTFRVQRTWSNASAAAGHDPCVPALAAPYQGAAPVFAEDLPIQDSEGNNVTTKGVSVAVGASKTIDLALFSDAPTADFTVRAIDAGQIFGGSAELSFALDRPAGHNGDTIKLTVTRTKQGQGGSEFLVVIGAQGQASSLWWGFAGN